MQRSLFVWSGIAGIASVASYVVAAFVPWPETQLGTSAGLLAASGFPILGVLFSYGIYRVVAAERDGNANRLGFVFATAAFVTLLAMLIVQLAVGGGIAEVSRGLDAPDATALRRGLRLVDLGLDVAWDFLVGTAMICWAVAMRRRSGLGLGWGAPLAVLGVALILLNAATFPWPPATRGLFDIGPFIALYWVAVAVRFVVLGRAVATSPSPPAGA